MSLPTSRNTTYVAGVSQVDAADLNALQDWIVTLRASEQRALAAALSTWLDKGIPGIAGTITAFDVNDAGTWVLATNDTGTMKIGVSSSGVRYLEGTFSVGPAASITKLVHGGGMWVACESAGANVYSSPDGITWTQRATGAFASGSIQRAYYANGQFVLVGGTGGSPVPGVVTSPDGITWTVRTPAAGWGVVAGNLLNVVYSSTLGLWVISGSSTAATVWTSAALAANDLTARTLTSATGISRDLTEHEGTVMVTVSDAAGLVYTSTNGTAWTQRSTGLGAACDSGPVYMDSDGRVVVFALGGATNQIATSDDYGVTWTPRDAPPEITLAAMTSSRVSIRRKHGAFVCGVTSPSGNVLVSVGGETWRAIPTTGTTARGIGSLFLTSDGTNLFGSVGAP